jgi:hypothetical protein
MRPTVGGDHSLPGSAVSGPQPRGHFAGTTFFMCFESALPDQRCSASRRGKKSYETNVGRAKNNSDRLPGKPAGGWAYCRRQLLAKAAIAASRVGSYPCAARRISPL